MNINKSSIINTVKLDVTTQERENIKKIPLIETELENKLEKEDLSTTNISTFYNDMNYADKTYVQTAVSKILTESGEVDLTGYATVSMLNYKVDKVTGKELINTTEILKLEGVEEYANNYRHPETHSAKMIEETEEKNFVSLLEKAEWNSKSNFRGTYEELIGTPDIPTKLSELENDMYFASSAQLTLKADKSHVHNYNELEDLPVLFSGKYSDLIGTPNIPTNITDLVDDSDFVKVSQLATKADKVHVHSYTELEDKPTLFSGQYADLMNKPTIPTLTSELTNDSNYVTNVQLATKAEIVHNHSYNNLDDLPILFSGDYNDLTNKPILPTNISDLNNDSDFATTAQLSTKSEVGHTHTYNEIEGVPTSGFSGKYEDLIGKPTIPTNISDLNNDSNFATTEQLALKSDKTHIHNYSEIEDAPEPFSKLYSDLIGVPTIPTSTEDLTNDSGFITGIDLNSGLTTKANKSHTHLYSEIVDPPVLFSGNYSDLKGSPIIPTAISQLENDSFYVTMAQVEGKLAEFENGGEINLDGYITTETFNSGLSTKSDKTHIHSYTSLEDLPVLFSGNYNDLTGKPTIPTLISQLENDNNYITSSTLTTALATKSEKTHSHSYNSLEDLPTLFSGNYTDLINKPTIPTLVSQLENDNNYVTSSVLATSLASKSDSTHNHSYNDLNDLPVLFSGNYSDLIGKPTIPTLVSQLENDNNYITSSTLATSLATKANTSHAHDYNDLENLPILFSGNYTDLIGKPNIPAAVSELTNDLGFITQTQLVTKADVTHIHSYNDLEDLPALFNGNYNSLTNKPTIPTKVSELTNDNLFVTMAQVEEKIADIGSSGELTLEGYVTLETFNSGLATKSNTTHSHSYDNLSDLPVLFSGNYNDLTGKPTIPTLISQLENDSNFVNKIQLATKADSNHLHSYNDLSDLPELFNGYYKSLTNKPTIPTTTSQLTNDSGFVNTTQLATKADKTHIHNYSDLEDLPILFSGSYTDLTNKPTIPTSTSQLTNDSNFVNTTQLNTKANVSHSHSYTTLEDLPVLFSGSYTDLTDKPTVPSKTSELTNDSGFVNTTQLNTKANVAHGHSYNDLTDLPILFNGSYTSLTNKPTIPTLTSQLENDSSYITATQLNTKLEELNINNETALDGYVTVEVLNSGLATKASSTHSHSYDDLTNKPILFSGYYKDLIGAPTIPTATSELTNDSNFVTTIQLNTKADKSHVHSYTELNDLPVLFTGKYSDLTGKPTIPSLTSQLTNDSNFVNATQLATKADKTHAHSYVDLEDLPTLFSGNYSDLIGKPTIPTLTSQLTNDSNYVNATQLATKANVTHAHSYNDLEDLPILFNGSYANLTNKPTIPTKTSQLTNDSNFVNTTQLATKANVSHGHSYNDLEDLPTLFNGSYTSLTNKPTIPTKVSQLTNDLSFVNTTQLNTKSDKDHVHSYNDLNDLPALFNGNYNSLTNKPTIPTKVSDLENDLNLVDITQLNTRASATHTHSTFIPKSSTVVYLYAGTSDPNNSDGQSNGTLYLKYSS